MEPFEDGIAKLKLAAGYFLASEAAASATGPRCPQSPPALAVLRVGLVVNRLAVCFERCDGAGEDSVLESQLSGHGSAP